MKVLEIKNNLVKIAYETSDNLALSEFVIIEDSNNPYVGQIMNLKADSSSNFAIVKLLFTFNEEGILKNYNGTIPSIKATVSKLPSNELLDIIPADTPLTLGTIAQQNVKLTVDKSILENNLLICSNNLQDTSTLLNNIIPQINEKAVIIDTDGQLGTDNKIIPGKDFKLPLNIETINYIYENDLEDIDATSKAIIQDIFIEVQKYIKSLPENFLPFDTFISVIDSQYRETQMPQLILLKNKLLKYKELNIFAQTIKDILDLSIKVENSNNINFDLSDIPENLQREIIRYIYSVLTTFNENIYSFVKVYNSNISKKLLKRFIDRDNIFTTVICPHEFKYIEDLKAISQNMIFFAPLTLQHDFASYNTFLSKLNKEEFIIYGAHTQNIPLICELAIIEENNIEQPDNTETPVVLPVETDSVENIDEEIIQPEEDFVQEEDTPIEESEPVTINDINDSEIIEETQTIDNVEIVEEETEPQIYDSDETIIEESLDENLAENYETIITDENIEIEPLTNNDEIVEQVAKDVDKIFYEKLPSEDEETIEETIDIEEELTEDDLNLIDDLSLDEDITLAADLENELTNFEEEQPPVVPIYPAEDEVEETISFNPGDHVSSPKFGEGIVERMVPYGNKTLCSISFNNVGRRLLDPAVTEINKLS